jgi:hypothetical protein
MGGWPIQAGFWLEWGISNSEIQNRKDVAKSQSSE